VLPATAVVHIDSTLDSSRRGEKSLAMKLRYEPLPSKPKRGHPRSTRSPAQHVDRTRDEKLIGSDCSIAYCRVRPSERETAIPSAAGHEFRTAGRVARELLVRRLSTRSAAEKLLTPSICTGVPSAGTINGILSRH
jgi:hypothetical protein